MNKCTNWAALSTMAALACASGVADAQVRVGAAGAGVKAGGNSAVENGVAYRLLGDGQGDQGDGGNAVTESLVWDNGTDDRVVAYLSTVNAHVSSEVADDCWLKEGLFYHLDKVTIRVGVTNGFVPNFELRIYEDCDGRPDVSLAPMVVAPDSYTLIGPGAGDMAALTIYDVCYTLDQFVQGEHLRWLSPVHVDTVDYHDDDLDVGGFGYWLSANNGTIQGRQAQVRSAALLGSPDFVDAEDEICCGICTDMYMNISGKCCWRVLAQSNPDLSVSGGLFDPVLSQNAPWVRSFDDFQLADPCNDAQTVYGICRIEAFVATNCDVTTMYGEIFNNLCDMPVDPDNARYTFAPDWYEDLGITLDGLPVYRFVFHCPEGVNLEDGQNYWFSIFSEQGFVAGKRTVWLFEQRQPCDIRLNEAKYRNTVIGYDMATPVSDPGLAGTPRGHAFSVWVCEPDI